MSGNPHAIARELLAASPAALGLAALAIDNVQAIALALSAYGQDARHKPTHAWGRLTSKGAGLEAAMRDDPHGVAAVLGVADDLEFSRDELAWVIGIESRWDPAARNPVSNASGLIQWMPGTLAGMKAPPAVQVRAMSRAEQAPLIRDYFARNPKPRVVGDVYLSIFNPGGIGQPDDAILYNPGSQGWTQNPGLRDGAQGPITAGSVRRKGTPPPPQSFTDDATGAEWLVGELRMLPRTGRILALGGTDGDTLAAELVRDGYVSREPRLRAALDTVQGGLGRPNRTGRAIAVGTAAAGLLGVALGAFAWSRA